MSFKNYVLIIITLIGFNCHSQKKDDQPISYKDDLTFSWNKTKDSLIFRAQSKSLAPIEIILYSQANNQELEAYLLNAKDSITLLKLPIALSDSITKQHVSDSIRFAYYLGHKKLCSPNLDYNYRFPFKAGKRYEVSQGFNGKFSHHSERSKYAIDFQLDVGEPVFAARGGLVIKVIDWFTKQGGKALINAANKILILHDDGTIAAYVHLQYKSSLVKEGERVQQGQKIGFSGVTGFTRGPHLHFVVRKERDMAIPIYFKGFENKVLKKGKRYKLVD